MFPLNKTKKKHIFLAKKLCMCKQKSNTFFSKNNCVCASGQKKKGEKSNWTKKKKRHERDVHYAHGHFGQPRCTVFPPFWGENFLVGPRKKHSGSTTHFPSPPPNQTPSIFGLRATLSIFGLVMGDFGWV